MILVDAHYQSVEFLDSFLRLLYSAFRYPDICQHILCMLFGIQIKKHRLIFSNIFHDLFDRFSYRLTDNSFTDIVDRTSAFVFLVLGTAEKLLALGNRLCRAEIHLCAAISAKHFSGKNAFSA